MPAVACTNILYEACTSNAPIQQGPQIISIDSAYQLECGTHCMEEITCVSVPSSGVVSVTGCLCRLDSAGLPVSCPRRRPSCFCSSKVRLWFLKNTTPRWETSRARSRMSSSELGAERRAEIWVDSEGNVVPMWRVSSTGPKSLRDLKGEEDWARDGIWCAWGMFACASSKCGRSP